MDELLDDIYLPENREIVKPVIAAALTAGIAKMSFASYKNWNDVLWFGAAVGGGMMIGNAAFHYSAKESNAAKTLGSRTIETAVATGSGLVMDIAINGYERYDFGSKTLTVLASELLSEIATNYIYGVEIE